MSMVIFLLGARLNQKNATLRVIINMVHLYFLIIISLSQNIVLREVMALIKLCLIQKMMRRQ